MAQVIDSTIAVGKSENDSLITRDGTLNYLGEPAIKSETGRKRVLPFIFGAEFAERCAAFGVSVNIITYLFYVKHIHLSEAANLVTNFLGASYIFTLLGGYLADTWLGRFRTIYIFAVVQTLGCAVLIINSALDKFKCVGPDCSPAKGADLALIYLGLYLVALGTGGIKSSVSPFGAEQFEKEDPNEAKELPHYFNWFFFAIIAGVLLGSTVIVYIQDRNWPWGFGSLVIVMFISLVLLIVARKRYRYKVPQGSPFSELFRVLVVAVKNRSLSRPGDDASSLDPVTRNRFNDALAKGAKLRVAQTSNMRWLDKAAVVPEGTSSSDKGKWSLATVTEVENLKMVLRLLPILATTWLFWTADSQFLTFTVTQATTSNRRWSDNFVVPPASIGAIKSICVLVVLVIYDKAFLPAARKITGHPSGITTLQRIGCGLACSILAMICAALVERRRLEEVHKLNWEAKPFTPMKSFSMFWYVPQYFIMGIGEALVYPGQIDFFYTESPENMQSLGTSLCLATLAVGAFGSSVIVSAVNAVSKPNWINKTNVNISRLDNYFWLLAVLSALNFVCYLVASSFHTYKKTYLVDSFSDDEESRDTQPYRFGSKLDEPE